MINAVTMQPPEWAPPRRPTTPHIAPGWYPDQHGVMRYYDGQQWTEHAAPQSPIPVQPNVRQAQDRSQYVRQQTGHSIIKHLLFGWIVLWIPTIYYAVSPNHYFHL